MCEFLKKMIRNLDRVLDSRVSKTIDFDEDHYCKHRNDPN